MSKLLPSALEKLITQFEALPGVGRRTAERYAYGVFRSHQSVASALAKALDELHQSLKYCPETFCLIGADQDVSRLYSDPSRDKTTVAVVASPFDVIAIESTDKYRGTYHVLKGLLSPIDGVTPQDLTIRELLERITKDKVKELILATSGSVEGESTALYIQKYLPKNTQLKVTRLARGLPVGVDVEFADQITLTQALEGRRPVAS